MLYSVFLVFFQDVSYNESMNFKKKKYKNPSSQKLISQLRGYSAIAE